MADLRYVVDIDTRNAQRNLSAIQTDITALGGSMRNLAGIFGVAFSAQQIVKVAGDFENLRTTLGILYKDANAGAAAFDNIKNLATQTAFGVEDLTSVYTKLLTAGINPTTDKLRLFADVSSVAADSVGALQAITDLYARTTAGGLGLEDLNRLADRGIPVYQILAKSLNLSRLEVAKFGQSAQGAQKILATLETELQKTFGGASAARIGTLNQAMSNLSDSVKNLIDRTGQMGATGGLTEAINNLSDAINNIGTKQIGIFFDMAKAVGSLIAAFLLVTRVLPALNGGFARLFAAVGGGVGVIGTFSKHLNLIGNGVLVVKGLERALANLVLTFGGMLGISNTFNKNIGTMSSNLLGVVTAVARLATRFTALTAIIYGVVEGASALEKAFFGTTYIEQGVRLVAIALEDLMIVLGNIANLPGNIISRLFDAFPRIQQFIKDFNPGNLLIALGESAQGARELDEYTKQANAELQAMADHNKVIAASQTKVTDTVAATNDQLERAIRAFTALQRVQMAQNLQAIKDRFGTTLDQLSLEQDLLKVNNHVAAGIRAQVAEEDRLYEAVRNVKNQIELTKAKLAGLDAGKQPEEYAKANIELTFLIKHLLDISALLNNQPQQIRDATEALERARFLREKDLEATQALLEAQDELNAGLALTADLQREAYASVINIGRDIRKELQLNEQKLSLERAIKNLRGEDADAARELFALEQRRKDELYKISQTLNLTADDRAQAEASVNREIDAGRKLVEDRMKLTREEQDNFALGWANAFEKWRNNLQTNAERAAEMFSTLTRGFEDAIVRFVQTGKLSFRSLFNDLIAQAARASANKLLMSILGGGRGLLGGFGFGTGMGFGNMDFGGFFANGGTLGAGKWGIAGEAGPEIVKGPASITPISQAAQPSVTNVTYNIQAVDASSFRSLVARDPEFIFNVTEQGRRQLPSRSRR